MNTFTAPCKVRAIRTNDGDMGLLTPCHGATATGTGDGRIVCRQCHSDVPSAYGMHVATLDGMEAALEALGCPVPEDCAHEVFFHLTPED